MVYRSGGGRGVVLSKGTKLTLMGIMRLKAGVIQIAVMSSLLSAGSVPLTEKINGKWDFQFITKK